MAYSCNPHGESLLQLQADNDLVVQIRQDKVEPKKRILEADHPEQPARISSIYAELQKQGLLARSRPHSRHAPSSSHGRRE